MLAVALLVRVDRWGDRSARLGDRAQFPPISPRLDRPRRLRLARLLDPLRRADTADWSPREELERRQDGEHALAVHPWRDRIERVERIGL